MTDDIALEKSLPIVDAHHHLVHEDDHRYTIEDYAHDVDSGHNIVATVYVECRTMWRKDGAEEFRCVGETEFATGIFNAGRTGLYGKARFCEAIVSFADLSAGSKVGAVLDAHLDASNGRVRGVRQSALWSPHADVMAPLPQWASKRAREGLLLEKNFRLGVAELARRQLSFESTIFHPQIPELAALAAACPDARILLVHLGLPLGIGPYAGRRAEVAGQWRAAMSDLAKRPNVWVKLGGLGMPFFGQPKGPVPSSHEELADAWRPYIEETIELFGADRCMFESNFPPDKKTCSYRTLWNVFKTITRGYTANEKAALFARTSATFYGIALTPDASAKQ